MTDALSRKDRVHRGLLDAGLRLFLRYGLRKTSMEAIADETQVAKATAYAYFPNKNAVFTAVVEDVISTMVAEAEAAAGLEVAPLAAIARSMSTKFVKLFELVHTSSEGAELLAASNQLSAEAVKRGHDAYVAHLAKLLVAAEVVERRKATELAEVLDSAAEGVVARATSREDAERRIAVLVDRLVAGPLPRA
ncbi:MAG: helix-turn-helix domain-containing protein [Myxococcales bacterium]|nr:helix-turn-helix domain-containing protein [Myxococcales bacterium]